MKIGCKFTCLAVTISLHLLLTTLPGSVVGDDDDDDEDGDDEDGSKASGDDEGMVSYNLQRFFSANLICVLILWN